MLERGRTESLGQTPQFRVAPADPFGSPQWNDLAKADDEKAFCTAWLALQCAQIPGIIAGWLVVRNPQHGSAAVSARWPERDLDFGDLSRLADRAHAEGRTIIAQGRVGPDTSPAQPITLLVAVPLGGGGVRLGVAAVALTTSHGASAMAPERVAELLKWGAGWLEALPWVGRFKSTALATAQAASCLDLVAALGEQPRLRGMMIALVNDLVPRLRCDRVSLGVLRRNGLIRLRAMSHSATFKAEGRLIDAIENAMEEAVDQCTSIVNPPLPATGDAAHVSHAALTDVIHAADASTMSVALADSEGKPIGALTFERHGAAAFDSAMLQLAEAIAALIGPTLALQLRANRPLAGSIADFISDAATALVGPRRPTLKLVAGVVAVLALILVLAKGEHRVTAKSVLEAEVLRAAVAPFDGYVRTANVRAGDLVHTGDLLAALDDRDLVLDRLKWRAERDKLVQKRRDALAKHERTDIVVSESQIRQAEAQLALAAEKLSRARILAPFDGVVVSGDLSQSLGSPIEKGKTLFEIAPLNAYRLIVQVDERDVRYVATGQRGTVAITGAPGRPLPIVLTKITLVSSAEEGQNFFRIEAQIGNLTPALRPGMEGVAKIDAGRRSFIWIWTHAVIDSVRLAAWKYLP
jgi:RND family efflux transporter MFP subunit